MRSFRFILIGTLFGITMVKSEAASWYRIQEMFRFQSFHMYGIIGTAVILGMLSVYLIKKIKVKDSQGNAIIIPDKDKSWKKYIIGGLIFGLGWALTGACPGPMFVNIGYGYLSMIVVVFGAMLGTFVYGVTKKWLPH